MLERPQIGSRARMRILLLSWEYPPVVEGGLARAVRKLSEQLVREGAEVHVVTRGGGRLPAEEDRHGVTVHRVREPTYPKGDVEAFIRWVEDMNVDMLERGEELFERLHFDLVHSHDWLVAGAAEPLARRHGLPWVVTVHATEFGRHQGWVDNYPQSHIHGLEDTMVRRADAVVACSNYMRGHMASAFNLPARQITVIPNGIDPRDLESFAGDLDAFRAGYAAPNERLVLLVGRLVYEKGFHLALDALAGATKRLGDVRFVVAGTGTAEVELKKQAHKLGLTRHGSFLGWVGDDMLHSLYRISDVCIVPSIYEPFGLVALEAMASGCLTIVADTGGLREVMPGDGSVGLRFRSRDSDSLGTTLETVLADDDARDRLVAAAREHVLKFDWARVGAAMLELYRGQVAARDYRPSLSRSAPPRVL